MIERPQLARWARYRWDKLRGQHQLLFPEGVLVLNDSAAAIVRLCDGRSHAELLQALAEQFDSRSLSDSEREVQEFLEILGGKGLLCDAADDDRNGAARP